MVKIQNENNRQPLSPVARRPKAAALSSVAVGAWEVTPCKFSLNGVQFTVALPNMLGNVVVDDTVASVGAKKKRRVPRPKQANKPRRRGSEVSTMWEPRRLYVGNCARR